MNKTDAIFAIALGFTIVLQVTPLPFDDIVVAFFSFLLGWKKTFQLIGISSLLYGLQFWKWSLFAIVFVGFAYFVGMTITVVLFRYFPSKTLKSLRKRLGCVR